MQAPCLHLCMLYFTCSAHDSILVGSTNNKYPSWLLAEAVYIQCFTSFFCKSLPEAMAAPEPLRWASFQHHQPLPLWRKTPLRDSKICLLVPCPMRTSASNSA